MVSRNVRGQFGSYLCLYIPYIVQRCRVSQKNPMFQVINIKGHLFPEFKEIKTILKRFSFIAENSPFQTGFVELQNIVTGLCANQVVNVDEFFDVGHKILQSMEGKNIFSISFKRSTKVRTLAASEKQNKIDHEAIDPALLFQRLLLVAKSRELDVVD